MAVVAAFLPRNLNLSLGAVRGFLKRDLEVVSKVRPALRPAATPAAAEEVAEPEHVAEVAEDVFEPGEDAGIEAAGTRRRAHARVAKAIIGRAFLDVGKHRIGLGAFLEFLLGGVIARIAVRVIFERQFPVGALDFGIGRRPLDAEDLVVVPLAHALATLTIAGRSRRSPSMYPLRSSPMTSPSRCSGLTSCMTAWWMFGSKSAPTASIGVTPRFFRKSCSLAWMSSTPLR